jgi:uncharacterized protein YjbI with pentapeptide repeats
MSTQSEHKVRAAERQGRSAFLIVGVLLGASLGAALSPAVERLQLSKINDQLFSFALGAFVAIGICLVIAGVSALLIVPRFFASTRGTLTAMVNDLTQASRAYHEGNSTKAIDDLGRAAEEGTAWYSIVTTRRFVTQAALGLLIAFGGVLGAVLLFNQNALLRDQNVMIGSQLKLLTDQNKMIDQQLKLLVDQNGKIEQQTMVADAQRRGAFLTEMFSIVQEVSKSKLTDAGALPNDLVARINVLTSSAIPYFYLDYQSEPGQLKPIQRALSPERGQIIASLARMGLKLSLLSKAGAQFTQADLRGIDLSGVDLTDTDLTLCDFTGAKLTKVNFTRARLYHTTLDRVFAQGAKFDSAIFGFTAMNHSNFRSSSFDRATFFNVTIKGGELGDTSFVDARIVTLKFDEVAIARGTGLPKGLAWPEYLHDWVKQSSIESPIKTVSHEFGFDWRKSPSLPSLPPHPVLFPLK